MPGVRVFETSAGHVTVSKYLVLTTGLLHKQHTPDFPGIQDYNGEICHSGAWPAGVDVAGKKIGLIGAGATAVQITQELGKRADQLTRPFTATESDTWRPYLGALFAQGRLSAAGFPATAPGCGVFDVTKEEREALNYNNVLIDKAANREVYDFWARKTRERMTDPVKRDIVAPIEPPYFYGTKRNPLENDYYEVLDKPNVEIVDLVKTPLEKFVENGIVTADDKLREFDIVVLATGFDSFTGSMTNMGLKNKDGVDMKEVWKDGVWTYLGIMTAGFPNMFMVFSPQECQVDFVVDAIAKLESENVKSIEPFHEAEVEWKDIITSSNDKTLFPFTSSWWTGGNVPGKKAESLNYVFGLESYERDCRKKMEGWKGFDVVVA
ncbi:hypothetical protein BDV97DRAFT_375221 [Delphinella strobiligena]|nr:hypothetical protein BDV97DRAFT_375221 [Delphinella strobiligena]